MSDPLDVVVGLRVDPEGRVVGTPMSSEDPEAQSFIDAGQATVVTPELAETLAARQAEDDERRAELGRTPLGVGVQGAAAVVDEALLGMLSRGNEGARQELQRFAEVHPYGDAGLRAGAWIVPAILSGGESAVARAMGALPGGMATRLGLGLEGVVGRSLAGLGAGEAASYGISTAAGASLDGMLSSIGEYVARSGVQGTDLEAEELVASGLFGGGIGLVGGGALAIPGMLRRGMGGGAGDAISGAARAADSGLEVPVSPRGPDGRRRLEFDVDPAFPEADTFLAYGALGGDNARRIRQVEAARRMGYDVLSPDGMRLANREAAESLRNGMNGVEEAFRRGTNPEERVRAAMGRIAPDVPVTQLELGQNEIVDLLDEASQRAAHEGQEDLGRELAGMQEVFADLPSSPEVFVRQVDSFLSNVSANQRLMQVIDSQAASPLALAYNQARAHLQALGPGGRALSNWHEAFRRRVDVGRVAEFAERRVGDDQLAEWMIHADDMQKAFDGQAGEAVPRQRAYEMARLVDDQRGRVEAIEDLFGEPLDGVREALENGLDRLDIARWISGVRGNAVRLQLDEKQVAGFFAGLGVSGATVGGMVGGPLGGVAGAAAGLGLAALSHPMAALRLLGGISERLTGVRRRVATSTGRLRGALQRGSWARTTAGKAPVTIERLRSVESREKAYREYRDKILGFVANPSSFVSQVSETAGVVSSNVSPVIGDGMAAATFRGVQYLAAELPPADQPSLFDVFEEDMLPSLTEMDVWRRKFEAVEDPISIIDLAAEGRLTVEHAEAVAAVYPQLYAGIQATVTDMIADLDDLPTYQQRMQLGTLLNVPVDRTLGQDFVHLAQQSYAQTSQQDQAQRAPALRRSISMSYSDDTQTASQSVVHTLG